MVQEIRSVGRRQVRNEKGNYEESYIKHGVGVGRPVGMGAGIRNNYHHDYDRGNRTITEFTPGSTIVLKETAGPKHYRFGKKVVYVTRSGKELDEATVRTRVKVGVPVSVHYAGEGDSILVDRVVLDED